VAHHVPPRVLPPGAEGPGSPSPSQGIYLYLLGRRKKKIINAMMVG
jgi:hypothetical protein